MTRAEPDSVGIMAQLFAGTLDGTLIFPYPRLSADEAETVEMLVGAFREFAARRIDSAKMDETHEMPKEVLDGLFELGLMGLSIPEEYGGAGFSMQAYCKTFEAVGGVDAATAVTAGAHQSIGMKALLLFGTEAQKRRYLPMLASGERLAAYALTEPGAGSDAGAIRTRAIHDPATSTFVLDGSKLWITNGGWANFYTVFAKDTVGGKEAITAFLVEGEEIPGLTRGKPERKMGIRASNTAELHLEGVRVPEANVLGERGKGYKVALEVLDYGRLSLGAGCVGGMKVLLRHAAAHARERRQFGVPIGDLEMIRGKLARMAQDIWAAESMVTLAASLVDRGVDDFSLESAICKAFCSEAAWNSADEAMQIVGGIGYMAEYPYERMMRDTRINLIFEGTNEIQRPYITLAGLKRQGEFFQEMQKGGKMAALVEYSRYAVQKRLTTPHLLPEVHPSLSWFSARVEEWAKAFSLAADKAIVDHGKKVVKMGFLQERLGDAAIHLFGMIATLSRLDTLVKERGEAACAHERALTRAWFGRAWRKVRQSLLLLEDNGDRTTSALAVRVLEDGEYRVLQ